jgi:uncharacterized protein YdhG (YjbR/CyaY superfamily)
MKSKPVGFISVDEYIASFPQEIQVTLEEMRATIKAAAPDAEEKISYQMPAFVLKGMLVYFAAWKKHIGFYAGSSDNVKQTFKDELANYEVTKGAIQFPFGKPLPLELISNIVKLRVAENLANAETKSRKKK